MNQYNISVLFKSEDDEEALQVVNSVKDFLHVDMHPDILATAQIGIVRLDKEEPSADSE